MNAVFSENESEAPFLIPNIPWGHEKCKILQQFKLVIRRLPAEIQNFLYTSFVDPYFIQLRQTPSDPTSVPRNRRLTLLYQCIRRCQHEEIPYAICAISIITGLAPKIILDHNRIHLPQSKLDIIEALHQKATIQNPEPIYAFSGRIEVTPMTEILPTTLLWTLPTNPLSNQNLLSLPAIENTFFAMKNSLNNDQSSKILKPLEPDEISEELSEQHRYYLLPQSIRKGLRLPFFYSNDLSEGFNPAHGLPPVPCFNEFDDQMPPPIRWIAECQLPDSIPQTYNGCKCANCDCCKCHILSFDDNKRTMCYTKDGKINLEELNECRPLIIECNPNCCCDPLCCKNRVVQNKSHIQLMVIRSKSKSGWGVRTMEFIPKGSFVCEYVGTVISDPKVAEMRGRECDKGHESYLFDLDAYGVPDDEMVTIDSLTEGNVSKFINHSCSPNLVQISIGTVESHNFHRIGFFAARNIYPNEELGFHYNYTLDDDPDRFIECNCGCPTCRTRLR